MSDFKVGDKVKCIGTEGWDGVDRGVLTIVSDNFGNKHLYETGASRLICLKFVQDWSGDFELVEEESLVLEEYPLESYPSKNSSEERQLVGKKFQVHGLGDVYKVIGLQDGKYHIINDSTPTDTECRKHTKEAVYSYFDEGTWVFLDKNQIEDVKPIKSDGGSSAYYDTKVPEHYLQLIKNSGVIKVEQLIDIIFNNDFDFGCAFKALVRAKGITDGAGKEGNTLKYELNKIAYYSDKIEDKYNWSNPC